jgi:hypothetical protein
MRQLRVKVNSSTALWMLTSTKRFDRLMSKREDVIVFPVAIDDRLITIGCLCLKNSIRHKLTEPVIVNLYDDDEYVCSIELSPDYIGEKHGYVGDVVLKLVPYAE